MKKKQQLFMIELEQNPLELTPEEQKSLSKELQAALLISLLERGFLTFQQYNDCNVMISKK